MQIQQRCLSAWIEPVGFVLGLPPEVLVECVDQGSILTVDRDGQVQ
jgi:hypothetical protein